MFGLFDIWSFGFQEDKLDMIKAHRPFLLITVFYGAGIIVDLLWRIPFRYGCLMGGVFLIAGKVCSKRALLSIVIETDGQQESETFQKFTEDQIKNISKSDVTSALLEGNLWPVIRQRPFSKVADPHKKPKAIFIHAMNTEPLALDIDSILKGKEKEFQTGLDILIQLTEGNVHLCVQEGAQSKALTLISRGESWPPAAQYLVAPH